MMQMMINECQIHASSGPPQRTSVGPLPWLRVGLFSVNMAFLLVQTLHSPDPIRSNSNSQHPVIQILCCLMDLDYNVGDQGPRKN